MEQMVQGILVVNTETIPGMVITETLGVVSNDVEIDCLIDNRAT